MSKNKYQHLQKQFLKRPNVINQTHIYNKICFYYILILILLEYEKYLPFLLICTIFDPF
jgi:hypothetical protein